MSWPMVYGPLAASGASAGPVEFFNFDFEEYANDAVWSETGWSSGVTWRVFDDAGDNIIYPQSSGEWWNTYDTSEENVVMIAGIKETTSNTLSGVVGRYLNNNNFLLLEAVRNEGLVKVYIRQGGTWTLLTESDPISFSTDVVIEYRLEINGNNVVGYRNDVEVVSNTLAGTETLGTSVGLYVGTGQPNFSYMSASTV